jgi:rubrerythrin
VLRQNATLDGLDRWNLDFERFKNEGEDAMKKEQKRVHLLICLKCGRGFLVPRDFENLVCPHCGQEYYLGE